MLYKQNTEAFKSEKWSIIPLRNHTNTISALTPPSGEIKVGTNSNFDKHLLKPADNNWTNV